MFKLFDCEELCALEPQSDFPTVQRYEIQKARCQFQSVSVSFVHDNVRLCTIIPVSPPLCSVRIGSFRQVDLRCQVFACWERTVLTLGKSRSFHE